MNIAYTVYPSQELSQQEWEKEFKVGTLAPKSREGRDKALAMMKLWEDKNNHIDFSEVIKRLEA